VESPACYVISKVRPILLGDGDCIKAGCEIESVDPSVATEPVLFGANISLRHRECMCDSVEHRVVLAYAAFLWLCWIISHV
jgi:hypothetical protein